MGAHSHVEMLYRDAIEAEIAMHLDRAERLIARLDRWDGDCDLEDDDAGGGNIDDVPHDEEPYLHPLYALDQSRGPVNVHAANNAYALALYGDEPNGRVGWRMGG